ncbi:sulfurtransferase [Waterburya agarophytonicola K14]|uniref:Sulfurtransferase n=1 Tax=Waterburya agarophytonicola KI4 TaxID=2874699 RepID=A0A964BMH7_9CYAN|nr:sulfurtransferase [Waterburya agarophytonicola]MCC0176070.1 sulfurtransferase [Waterburya agarophytonicola KI4]
MRHTKYLVDSEWLEQNLDNPQVVIVDCRFQLADPNWGRSQYRASHIQGAYYLNLDRDLSSEVQLHGGRHPLPNMDVLTHKFASLGIIQQETLVVAYDDSRFAFAARLWWLLRYLGHDRVVLLDGGWQDWLKRNYPVNNAIPEAKSGNFSPQPHGDWLADINMVKASQSKERVTIIDSRDRDRYLGLTEPIDPIAGSIAGAVNSPWKQVSNELGYLQPLEIQQQLWQDYRSAEEIIVYCGSGVTACVNLFSLALAGVQNTKLYAGGWSDWCSYLN